jgi:creatinine amidohydrolase
MDMTWTDLAEADTRRWIAVLPVAAVEQHGPHLPLGVDSYIAKAYLSRVHELVPADLPVSFLPVQNIGQSDEHIAYPGTLSLSAQTIIRAYTEIGESLHRAGLRKLVIVTSHGGNVAAVDLVARDLRIRHRMLVVTRRLAPSDYPQGTFGAPGAAASAGDVETSLMLAGAATRCAWTPPRTPSPRRSAWRKTSNGERHPPGQLRLDDPRICTVRRSATRPRNGAKGEAAHAIARGLRRLLGDVDRFDPAQSW